MQEGISNRNIFLDSVEKINNSNKKYENCEIAETENNIFKPDDNKNSDVKKILDTSEKYTKEKYGSRAFLNELELMEEDTEYVEVKKGKSDSDAKPLSSTPVVSVGTKKIIG